MPNSNKTRHLIVTLPSASEKEADALIESIESHGEQARVTENGFSVDHILGKALPEDLKIEIWPTGEVLIENVDTDQTILTDRYGARQIAGALLAIPGVANAEPPTEAHL